MPKLNVKQDVKKFALPSTQDLPEGSEERAWVDFDVSPLTAGDLTLIDPTKSEVEASFALLAVRIKDWNFTDDADQKLEINIDTVSKLDIQDYSFLAEKLPQPESLLTVDQKKT